MFKIDFYIKKYKFQATPFLFAFFYGIIFYILQFFVAKTGVFKSIPNASSLNVWDVGFYDSIRQNGYDVHSDNTGFFVLFPWVWKLAHVGIWGICLINIIFFSTGFALLMRTLREQDKTFWLLCLTLPSVYFAFVPYSEALFFF